MVTDEWEKEVKEEGERWGKDEPTLVVLFWLWHCNATRLWSVRKGIDFTGGDGTRHLELLD